MQHAMHATPATPIDYDAIIKQLNAPKVTPSWLRKATKGVGYCAHCHTQHSKTELNAQKHCRHCASDLMETHPLNR